MIGLGCNVEVAACLVFFWGLGVGSWVLGSGRLVLALGAESWVILMAR